MGHLTTSLLSKKLPCSLVSSSRKRFVNVKVVDRSWYLQLYSFTYFFVVEFYIYSDTTSLLLGFYVGYG